MISQQALFTQMELKLQQAKQAQTEGQMREALSALQVLCNVVLDRPEIEAPVNVQPITSTQVVPTQPMQNVQQQSKSFDDANGTSIFDF